LKAAETRVAAATARRIDVILQFTFHLLDNTLPLSRIYGIVGLCRNLVPSQILASSPRPPSWRLNSATRLEDRGVVLQDIDDSGSFQ
jgi:hypothetical protein